MSYTVHPAADAFPMMSDAELEELAADIAANGLRHSLTLNHDGTVLIDGRNRLRACQIAGVDITDERLPEDWTDAQIIDYIVSANVQRRHLTPSQKAMVASALEPMYAEAARERMLAGKADPSADSREGSQRERRADEQAAKAVGASGRSVSDAKALKRDAPDLAEKVVNGDMTLNAATVERKKRTATPAPPAQQGKANSPPEKKEPNSPPVAKLVEINWWANGLLDDTVELSKIWGKTALLTQDVEKVKQLVANLKTAARNIEETIGVCRQDDDTLDAEIAALQEKIRVFLWRTAGGLWWEQYGEGGEPYTPPFEGVNRVTPALIVAWQNAIDRGIAEPVTARMSVYDNDDRTPDEPWPGLGLYDSDLDDDRDAWNELLEFLRGWNEPTNLLYQTSLLERRWVEREVVRASAVTELFDENGWFDYNQDRDVTITVPTPGHLFDELVFKVDCSAQGAVDRFGEDAADEREVQ